MKISRKTLRRWEKEGEAARRCEYDFLFESVDAGYYLLEDTWRILFEKADITMVQRFFEMGDRPEPNMFLDAVMKKNVPLLKFLSKEGYKPDMVSITRLFRTKIR